jgi:hypothetical protein
VQLLVASALAIAQLVTLQGTDGRGHPFDLTEMRGQVVAITFASRYTREEADRVHATLLAKQARLVVVSVVDLAGIPSLFHGYARRKAAEHDQAGRIVHVIDEHGDVKKRFSAEPQRRVDILVVGPDGELRGRFESGQLDSVLRLVDSLRLSE